MNRIEHHYGSNVHILKNPFLFGLLSRLCAPQTIQPEINRLVAKLYQHLLVEALNSEFPQEAFSQDSRMTEYHPGHQIVGSRPKPKQRAICVNIARAGTYPSHVCFDALHDVLEPTGIRQDHIFAARNVGAKDEVVGTEIGATKIGGDQDQSMVLIPDPMGATGNTLIAALDHYKNKVAGVAQKYLALHLIITPEYLKKVLHAHPDLVVYALRLDRGLSEASVLNSTPGKFWDKEKGLNAKDYIVPGGGGFGEIMNNSFV